MKRAGRSGRRRCIKVLIRAAKMEIQVHRFFDDSRSGVRSRESGIRSEEKQEVARARLDRMCLVRRRHVARFGASSVARGGPAGRVGLAARRGLGRRAGRLRRHSRHVAGHRARSGTGVEQRVRLRARRAEDCGRAGYHLQHLLDLQALHQHCHHAAQGPGQTAARRPARAAPLVVRHRANVSRLTAGHDSRRPDPLVRASERIEFPVLDSAGGLSVSDASAAHRAACRPEDALSG